MTNKVLAGLVSTAAAAAYDRLHEAVHLPVGTGPDRFDLTEEPARELLDAGVITFAGHGTDRLVRVVHPSIALRRLLDRQHRHLAALQSDLAETWQRFAALVSPVSGLTGGDLEGEDVRAVRDRAEMARLAAGLYRAPRRLLRATFTARSGHEPTTEGLLLPPADSIAAGVEFRMIYDAQHVSDSWGSYSIEQSVRAGEQARVRRTVPLKMMHVDDTVALVTIDHTGAQGALHIESPALLTLLASGLTDESIAHHTGTAVRTVRRHVSAILEVLQVDSRFAAGVAAVRRGWL